MRTVISHLLLLGLLVGTPAFAEDEVQVTEFDVEIIVVRNVTPDDAELYVTPMSGVEAEETSPDESPRPTLRRFPPLPADARRLSEVNERLKRSEDWSPILHYGWRQPVGSHDEAAATSVAASRLGARTTGTVRLSLDRFLRLELDLEFDPGTGELFRLDQARRVRSGQVHYFDHPRFGVIALVSRAPREPATP